MSWTDADKGACHLHIPLIPTAGLVAQFAGIPDVITLHAGLPPPASFPLAGLQLTTVQPLQAGVHVESMMNSVQKSAVQAAYQPLSDDGMLQGQKGRLNRIWSTSELQVMWLLLSSECMLYNAAYMSLEPGPCSESIPPC
jgi:hypothetical protein